MVNSLLLLVSLLTVAVWLAQELLARPLAGPGLVAESPRPPWAELAYKVVLGAWGLWLLAALWIKDGDFAFVLVVLTALAGLIGALDKWLFSPRREAQAQASASVPAGEEREELRSQAADNQYRIAEYARSFFPVLLVVLVLRSFVVEPFQIPSSSMEPTLEVGDYILVNKFAYGLRWPVLQSRFFEVGDPQRGDVMVFFPPGDRRYFIKRVIGLPGDRIESIDKVLYINGEPAEQTLLAQLPPGRPVLQLAVERLGEQEHMIHRYLRAPANDFVVTVSPGHYFMMGDNRDNSSDSRAWGEVPEDNIVGKAFAIWMHWGSMGALPRFDRVGAIR